MDWDSYHAIKPYICPVPPQVTAAWRYEDVAIRQSDLIATHMTCVLTENDSGLSVTQETIDRMNGTISLIQMDYPGRHFNYKAVIDSFGNVGVKRRHVMVRCPFHDATSYENWTL